MATDPRWLDGLTQVGDGVWRDEETGLEVQSPTGGVHSVASVCVDHMGAVDIMDIRPCACCRQDAVVALRWGRTGDRDFDRADRFAAAIKLAAKLARAYNESGGR